MPQWIHDRAKHLMDKNPQMPERMAWALATQQSYAAKKAPKSYGTREGHRSAKKKYRHQPSHYEQKGDPKTTGKSKSASVDTAFLAGFMDELEKIAAGIPGVPKLPGNLGMSSMTNVSKSMARPGAIAAPRLSPGVNPPMAPTPPPPPATVAGGM